MHGRFGEGFEISLYWSAVGISAGGVIDEALLGLVRRRLALGILLVVVLTLTAFSFAFAVIPFRWRPRYSEVCVDERAVQLFLDLLNLV